LERDAEPRQQQQSPGGRGLSLITIAGIEVRLDISVIIASFTCGMRMPSSSWAATESATTATVTIEPDDGGFSITAVHLDVIARIPGIDRQEFEKAANAAKDGCPVSKVLNADISLDARLVD